MEANGILIYVRRVEYSHHKNFRIYVLRDFLEKRALRF